MPPPIINPEVTFHRNGVGGRPFYTILFETGQGRTHFLLAILFQDGCCAILDVTPGKSITAMPWRPETFESRLRDLIPE